MPVIYQLSHSVISSVVIIIIIFSSRLEARVQKKHITAYKYEMTKIEYSAKA